MSDCISLPAGHSWRVLFENKLNLGFLYDCPCGACCFVDNNGKQTCVDGDKSFHVIEAEKAKIAEQEKLVHEADSLTTAYLEKVHDVAHSLLEKGQETSLETRQSLVTIMLMGFSLGMNFQQQLTKVLAKKQS